MQSWLLTLLGASYSSAGVDTRQNTAEYQPNRPQYLPSSQDAHLPTSLPVSHKLQGPPPSAEFMTLEHCTVPLETALSDLERDLVHFLCLNGFISDDVRDKVLTPVSVLSEGEKAGEVVRWIKKKVMQDPGSYHVLMRKLQQGGRRYQPIINKLEATRQKVARGQSVICFSVRYMGMWDL